MEKVSIIGLDPAKQSFQAHDACPHGGVSFRKKLSREKVPAFLTKQPRCIVAMGDCGSAHHWGRAIRRFGHDVQVDPARWTSQPELFKLDPFQKMPGLNNYSREQQRMEKRLVPE
jgi:transposase